MTGPEGSFKPPTQQLAQLAKKSDPLAGGKIARIWSLCLKPMVEEEENEEEEWEMCSAQTRLQFDLKHKRKEFIILIVISNFSL